MKRILTICLLVQSALFAATGAGAAEYNRILSDKSAIKFVYKQMNVLMEGSFSRYTSRFAFDPAKPSAGSASFEIDLSSIDTGASDADEEVRGRQWFNTKVYPQASFVSTTVKPLGDKRFEVRGKLTMKGKTQEITAPIAFSQNGANGVFEGVFSIKRADFAIGEGPWADFGTVTNDIQIKLKLVAGAGSK